MITIGFAFVIDLNYKELQIKMSLFRVFSSTKENLSSFTSLKSKECKAQNQIYG
jgi:hypothetical protein